MGLCLVYARPSIDQFWGYLCGTKRTHLYSRERMPPTLPSFFLTKEYLPTPSYWDRLCLEQLILAFLSSFLACLSRVQLSLSKLANTPLIAIGRLLWMLPLQHSLSLSLFDLAFLWTVF